jgi:hypothetical protein
VKLLDNSARYGKYRTVNSDQPITLVEHDRIRIEINCKITLNLVISSPVFLSDYTSYNLRFGGNS